MTDVEYKSFNVMGYDWNGCTFNESFDKKDDADEFIKQKEKEHYYTASNGWLYDSIRKNATFIMTLEEDD